MSSLIYRDIDLKRQKGAQQFEARVERYLVKQVRLNGNLKVPGRPGYVYVQQVPEDDAPPPVPVLCLGVQPREGLMGWVERNRDGLWEFVAFSRSIVNLPGYNGQAYLPAHHLDHEWPDKKPGPDAVNVYARAHVPLRAYPGEVGGLTISVAPLYYPVGTVFVLFPGQLNIDISASQPAVGLARYVGIYLDTATNAIATVDGGTVIDALPIEPPEPSFPRGSIPSAVVRLDGSQTTFSEADFSDRRSPLRGDGWKFSGVVRVVGPNGDYASVTLAAAAASAGDIIWVEADVLTDAAVIPAGVHLCGMGQQVTTITNGAASPTITLGDNCSIANIQVGNSFANGVAISASGFAYLYDTYAWVTGAGDPSALQTNASIVRLHNVTLTGKRAISMAGVAHSLRIFASNITGTVAGVDIYDAVGAGNTIRMQAVPTIGNDARAVLIDTTIAVYGTFVDPNGQLYSRTDGLGQFNERAGAPANPPTDNWDWWFEADGLHIMDDTGAEYILPGGIDPAGHTHSKLVASDGVPDPSLSTDAGGNATGVGWLASEAHGFKVKNTSGGAAVANDLGFVDENGEYKTITTAYSDVAWCVVIVGGANNADIYVARRGRVTVVLNGNCSAGDYLYTSTTAGQAQPQAYARPELFGVALTANVGGAGGTCSALLLCNSRYVNVQSSVDVLGISNISDSDFRATINGAPVGAAVVYNAPTSGNEDTINVAAGNQHAKIRLYNETRADYALIDSVNTGTNTITLTANAPGAWADTDVITTRSQTCVEAAPPPYYYDLDLSGADNTAIPELARSVEFVVSWYDTAAATYAFFHSWQTIATSKIQAVTNPVASQWFASGVTLGLFQRRFCVEWNANGAGTAFVYVRLRGYWVAEP